MLLRFGKKIGYNKNKKTHREYCFESDIHNFVKYNNRHILCNFVVSYKVA